MYFNKVTSCKFSHSLLQAQFESGDKIGLISSSDQCDLKQLNLCRHMTDKVNIYLKEFGAEN